MQFDPACNSTREDLASMFEENLGEDIKILFAQNDGQCGGSYEDGIRVVFRQGDKLFLVEGGHCSCHGFEGQWDPTETTKGALEMMSDSGYPEWRSFLETL